jgi:hypothetical protein
MGNEYSYTPKKKEKHSFGSYKDPNNARPGYFVTPSQVLYRGTEINATPSNFQKLGKSWAKDQNYVFFKGQVVKNADPKTFKYTDKKFKDKSGEWHQGKLVQ